MKCQSPSLSRIGAKATQADIESIRGDMPNVLICIGSTGSQLCYLNVDLEEARNRFRREFAGPSDEADPEEYDTWVLPFTDSFPAYEVG